MRFFIFTVFLFFSPVFVFAQQQNSITLRPHMMLKYRDAYYQNNLKGMTVLLYDIKKSEPALYHSMLPKLQKLKNDRNSGLVIIIVGAVVSSLILTSAFFSDSTDGVYGKLGLGTLIYTGSGVVAYIKMPHEQDYLNFFNQFNLKAGGEKIQLSVNPMFSFLGGISGGVGLSLRF